MDYQEWITAHLEPILESEELRSTRVYEALLGALQLLANPGGLPSNAVDPATLALQRRRRELGASSARGVEARDARHPEGLLRAVVPVAAILTSLDGIQVFLTSVELWAHAVHLNIAGAADEETASPASRAPVSSNHVPTTAEDIETPRRRRLLPTPGDRLADLTVTLTDDQGTNYLPIKSASGGSGTEWRMHMTFAPSAPPIARELTISVSPTKGANGGSLRVSLSAI